MARITEDCIFQEVVGYELNHIPYSYNPYYNEWHSAQNEVPDNDRYILLSFKNFDVPCVGRYEEDDNGGAYYIGDDDDSCSSNDLFVECWMELPRSSNGFQRLVNSSNTLVPGNKYLVSLKWSAYRDVMQFGIKELVFEKVMFNADILHFIFAESLEPDAVTYNFTLYEDELIIEKC